MPAANGQCFAHLPQIGESLFHFRASPYLIRNQIRGVAKIQRQPAAGPGKRRLFAAKYAPYLSRRIGLILVDAVTSRQGNMHNELIALLGLEASLHMPPDQALYIVAYRPLHVAGADRIEAWPQALALGQPLPTMPLSLEANH